MITTVKPSIIITTYKADLELDGILKALNAQSKMDFEVVIAEDASRQETTLILETWKTKAKFTLKHVFQEDKGYRKREILNKAILQATGNYCIFLDGDCIPHPRFVEDHCYLAQKGCFVQGRRCFIKEEAIKDFLNGSSIFSLILQKKIQSFHKAFRWPFSITYLDQKHKGIIGCNMGVWMEDLIALNGFDQDFEGWGREDSDLGARLYNLGKKRKLVYGRAVVYHLNHPHYSREMLAKNDSILKNSIETKKIRCINGLTQISS